jgi:hypothetical protein
VTVACPFPSTFIGDWFVSCAALGAPSSGTSEATRDGIFLPIDRINSSYIVCTSLMEAPSLKS